jgi:FAD/FMN-containing dehydrogenase
MVTDTRAASAAHELVAQLSPDKVFESGPQYDEARRVWNAAIENRPALIVRTQTPGDVQAAVLVARRHELPLSIRGGGHDWAGRAVRHGGLTIDLSEMRHVAVDPEAQVATLQGGATARDVISAAAPYGLVAATGTVGNVGMTGLTLGGGYGPLNGRFGLALDNVISADIVLADGHLVTTDPTREPELFWAIRGGGGNFGVVTSLRVRLHPVERLWAGLILYPWSQAAEVLDSLRQVIAAAPDELTVQTGVLTGPDGGPALFVSPTWSGDLTAGEPAMHGLSQLGRPLMSQLATMTYSEMLGLLDAALVPGSHYAIRTRSVIALAPDVIDALLEAGASRTSPLSAISIHHFHGASTRVPIDATAFGIRRPHHVVEIVAAWQPTDGDDGAPHRQWATSASNALARVALPGGYSNLLGPHDHDQIGHAFGPNASRLRAAKRRFDPDRVFSSIPLPLDVSATAADQGPRAT